jgi:hypothetical protein
MSETKKIEAELATAIQARDRAAVVLAAREEAVKVWEAAYAAVSGPVAAYEPGDDAPSDGSVTIRKPVKAQAGGEPDLWLPECTGRLVLGTGCGHCLRCNREWYALSRAHDVGLNRGETTWFSLSAEEVQQSLKFGDGKRIETVQQPFVVDVVELMNRGFEDTPKSSTISREDVNARFNPGLIVAMSDTSPERVALERWCVEWNGASKANNRPQMAVLEAHLRKMQFPPYVVLHWEWCDGYDHGMQVIRDVPPTATE